jgi:hypothetical protein
MVIVKKHSALMPKQKRTKTPKQPRNFSLRSTVRRRIHKIRKLITKQRIYISVAVIALIFVASTAAYAMNNPGDFSNHSPKPSTTNDNSSNGKNQTKTKFTTETPVDTSAIQKPESEDCYKITVEAEAQFLTSTGALVYPHYGDSHAVFDSYNNGYRQAYNSYLNSVRPHNCSITINDKGTVQYASPTCTQAYSDDIVVVLRNQIYSAVNLDMAEYNRWFWSGNNMKPDHAAAAAQERIFIQNKNDGRVRGYVDQANARLINIYCPALKYADFYTRMF